MVEFWLRFTLTFDLENYMSFFSHTKIARNLPVMYLHWFYDLLRVQVRISQAGGGVDSTQICALVGQSLFNARCVLAAFMLFQCLSASVCHTCRAVPVIPVSCRTCSVCCLSLTSVLLPFT